MGLVIVDKAMAALLLARSFKMSVPLCTVFALASRIHGLLDDTVVVFAECGVPRVGWSG